MDQIARDFSYHKPDDAVGRKIQANRDLLQETCRQVLAAIPPGREAMFWASAALARPPMDAVTK